MPKSLIVFYQEKAGDAPVVDWLRELNATNEKAHDKCQAALIRLALFGHELRRPDADYLRDGIHELRVRCGSVNYRLLYFFHEGTDSIVVHALTKEDIVPVADINRALARKAAFTANPTLHTFQGETADA
ncbi:MAG: type II toxin-antitoxin system RelE/ParE family toxin [Opitutaceae bacterium]